jgi:hypothetical protein
MNLAVGGVPVQGGPPGCDRVTDMSLTNCWALPPTWNRSPSELAMPGAYTLQTVSDPTATPPPFSWPKGLLQATALGLAFLGLSLLFAVGGKVNAGKAGELGGSFAIPGLAVGMLFSFAWQRQRRALATLSIVLLVVMLRIEVTLLVAMAKGGRVVAPLTAAEKAWPVMLSGPGGAVLCQAALGVSLRPNDVTLTPAPELEEKVNASVNQPNLVAWVFREGGGNIVVILGAKGFDSEKGLRDLAVGFSQGAQSMTNLQQRVMWADGTGTVTLGAAMPNGIELAQRCVTSRAGNLGCIQTIGTDPNRLATLRGSLSAGGCP